MCETWRPWCWDSCDTVAQRHSFCWLWSFGQFNPSVRINLVFLDSLAQSVRPYGPAGHCAPLGDASCNQRWGRAWWCCYILEQMCLHWNTERLTHISLKNNSDSPRNSSGYFCCQRDIFDWHLSVLPLPLWQTCCRCHCCHQRIAEIWGDPQLQLSAWVQMLRFAKCCVCLTHCDSHIVNILHLTPGLQGSVHLENYTVGLAPGLQKI